MTKLSTVLWMFGVAGMAACSAEDSPGMMNTFPAAGVSGAGAGAPAGGSSAGASAAGSAGGGSGGAGAAGRAGSAPPTGGSSGQSGASGGASGSGGAVAGEGGASAGEGGAGAGEGGAGGAGGNPSADPDPTGAELEAAPIGWASEPGDGVDTTTGGLGGQVVRPTSAQALMDYAESADRLIIELEGTFSVPRLQVNSNKTLRGVGEGATIEGGVRIRGYSDEMISNVIVQNLRIHGATSDADGDGMHIYFAHHVWIDHCEIWDSPDGNLDVVHASNWVTISWTKFSYTSGAPDAEHRFSNLIGHSDDNAGEDTDRLKVTFHHNWWAEGIIERMPRVRYGEVHVFNNYYSASGNNYAIGAGTEARLLIENNYFEGVNDPHIFYDGEPTAQIAQEGNEYANTTGRQDEGQGSSFMAPYDYELYAPASIKTSVMANAGPL